MKRRLIILPVLAVLAALAWAARQPIGDFFPRLWNFLFLSLVFLFAVGVAALFFYAVGAVLFGLFTLINFFTKEANK